MTNNKLRTNFSNTKTANVETDFLDIQIKSFQDFFQLETKSDERVEEGLFNTFKENFPITDARNQFVLEFLDYFVDPPRYTMHECIQRGLSYSVPLKARLKLYCTDVEHEDFETIVQDVFLASMLGRLIELEAALVKKSLAEEKEQKENINPIKKLFRID